jgi:two-component system LytT family response regulator
VDLLKLYLGGRRGEDELTFVSATEPRCFLEQARTQRIDLAFLDIDMAGMDGIELGGKLREMHADTVIVYVTAHEKYALEAFRVRAFHYLVKPLTRDKVLEVLSEALAHIRRGGRTAKLEEAFTLQRKGETVTLRMGDIACFEKMGHKIRVHTAGGYEEYYGNFTGLTGRLDTQDFIQCHQGYIVCVAKIRIYRDKTLFLDGGLKIPVSRMFAEKVRAALARLLFSGREGV